MEGGREAAAAKELAGGGGGGAVGAARRRGPRAVSHLVVLLCHQRRPRRLLPWPDGDLDEHDDGDGVAVTVVLEHLGGLAQRVADADGLPWPWAAAQSTRRSTIWQAGGALALARHPTQRQEAPEKATMARRSDCILL
uniref:Uncharacterized protein n=2 Tax=Oryza TaxID=4527 RepID=Q8LI50_ORYSJ|nr:hypothetical protein [Oryza sativa Japonica Group]